MLIHKPAETNSSKLRLLNDLIAFWHPIMGSDGKKLFLARQRI